MPVLRENKDTKVIFPHWLRSVCNGLSLSLTFTYPFETGDIWLQSALQSLRLFLLSGVWGSDRVKCRGRPISCLIKDCFLGSRTSKTHSRISLGERHAGQTGFKLAGNIVCSHFSLAWTLLIKGKQGESTSCVGLHAEYFMTSVKVALWIVCLCELFLLTQYLRILLRHLCVIWWKTKLVF